MYVQIQFGTNANLSAGAARDLVERADVFDLVADSGGIESVDFGLRWFTMNPYYSSKSQALPKNTSSIPRQKNEFSITVTTGICSTSTSRSSKVPPWMLESSLAVWECGTQALQDARYVIKSVICDPNFERLVLGCIEADFCK